MVKFKLSPLFNISWIATYPFCYINTHRGLLQCPIYQSIYGNTDTRVQFWQPPSSCHLVIWHIINPTVCVQQQYKENRRATKLKQYMSRHQTTDQSIQGSSTLLCQITLFGLFVNASPFSWSALESKIIHDIPLNPTVSCRNKGLVWVFF